MLSDEMTLRAFQAARAAEEQGFHATAEAFRGLARGCILDTLRSQPWIDQPPWTTVKPSSPEGLEQRQCLTNYLP